MDPDEALTRIRETRADLFANGEPYDEETVRVLLETLDGLDVWLTKGGFPPKAWIAKETIDMPTPNIGDTCCGKCAGGTCYVDQVTDA